MISVDFVRDYFRRRLMPMNTILPKRRFWYSQQRQLPTYITHVGWLYQFLSMLIDTNVVDFINDYRSFCITFNIGQTDQFKLNGGDQVAVHWDNSEVLQHKNGELHVSEDCITIEDEADFMDTHTLLQNVPESSYVYQLQGEAIFLYNGFDTKSTR